MSTSPNIDLIDEPALLVSESEADSLSDSDWLDIASSRESDNDNDTDSLFSHDEDEHSQTRSRRSSTSNASSRGEEVVAWQGIVEDDAIEGTLEDHDIQNLSFISQHATENIRDASTDTLPTMETETLEEQRVKEALDQSMISTLSLSASRSSTSSRAHVAQSSSRDLRLSFPDPLSSSREEVVRVSREFPRICFEPEMSKTPEITATIGDREDQMNAATIASIKVLGPSIDPGSNATPEVPPSIMSTDRTNRDSFPFGFDVYLYGSASSARHSIVHRFLEKAALGAGARVSPYPTHSPDGTTRWLHVQTKFAPSTIIPATISITDCTMRPTMEDSITSSAAVSLPSDRPSLALVFLPSQAGPTERHTYYLPVSVSPILTLDQLNLDSTNHSDNRAQSLLDWSHLRASLDITRGQELLSLTGADEYVIEQDKLEGLAPVYVYRMFERAFRPKKSPLKAIRESTSSVRIVTLLAILSVVLGFVSQMPFRSPVSVPVKTPTSTARIIWESLRANHSAAMALTTTAVPSMKEYALAVLNPSTMAVTSASPWTTRRPAKSLETVSHSGKDKENVRNCADKSPDLADSIHLTRDIVLRPSSSLAPVDLRSKAASLISTGGQKSIPLIEQPSTSAVSMRLAGTVAGVMDAQKVVVNAVRQDVAELCDALDELMQAIRRQALAILAQSQGTATLVRETVYGRHERAKGKAKELREKGEQIIVYAGERLLDRANTARQKARALAVVGTDAIVEYRTKLNAMVEARQLGKRHGRARRRAMRRRRSVT